MLTPSLSIPVSVFLAFAEPTGHCWRLLIQVSQGRVVSCLRRSLQLRRNVRHLEMPLVGFVGLGGHERAFADGHRLAGDIIEAWSITYLLWRFRGSVSSIARL